jgi:hypothetical protein
LDVESGGCPSNSPKNQQLHATQLDEISSLWSVKLEQEIFHLRALLKSAFHVENSTNLTFILMKHFPPLHGIPSERIKHQTL